MRILIIPSWYPTKTNRILGSFFREQALMLKKQGHDVSVIKVDLHAVSERIENKIEEFDDEGIHTIIKHVHSWGFARDSRLLCTVLKRHYKKLFNILLERSFNPDIIQAHSFLPAGYIACYLGDKSKTPVIVTEHSSNVHSGKLNKDGLSILKYVTNNSDCFVCVSESLKRKVVELTGQNNIKVLPNNLSSEFYYKHSKCSETFGFVCVGNLIDHKRQDLLIDCFVKAFGNGEEELYLAGQGVNYSNLKEKIIKLKMDKRIHLLGPLSRKEVAELLNRQDVFCLLSISETFGVAYIEALACGCPVLSTKNGGADELIDDSNGILVDVDDDEEIVRALNKIRKEYDSYELENISQKCIKKYSESAVYKQTIQLYDLVISKYKR